jgi:hypothetical protein
MISKIHYIAVMKTESNFADIYLDFIRKCGILSALRRDNAKSEMSQRVKHIHRDLIIADKWTEQSLANPYLIECYQIFRSHMLNYFG